MGQGNPQGDPGIPGAERDAVWSYRLQRAQGRGQKHSQVGTGVATGKGGRGEGDRDRAGAFPTVDMGRWGVACRCILGFSFLGCKNLARKKRGCTIPIYGPTKRRESKKFCRNLVTTGGRNERMEGLQTQQILKYQHPYTSRTKQSPKLQSSKYIAQSRKRNNMQLKASRITDTYNYRQSGTI